MKAVNPQLNRAVALDWVDLQSPGHEFANPHTARIVLNGVKKDLPACLI
jgi:hypothetical protein